MRFNQNDAMEFFQAFIELLNEDAKKINETVVLEQKMKSGVTQNNIICKDCQTQSQHREEWTSLCVPIPESVPMKKIAVEFIPWKLTE